MVTKRHARTGKRRCPQCARYQRLVSKLEEQSSSRNNELLHQLDKVESLQSLLSLYRYIVANLRQQGVDIVQGLDRR